MNNWSSSSACNRSLLTERQSSIFNILKDNPGDHTVSELSVKLGVRIEGADLETVQVKVLELRLGRIRRKRQGKFIYWKFKTK